MNQTIKAAIIAQTIGNHIELNGTDYPYHLVRSNRKSIAIQVKTDGSIHVRAPYRVSTVEIERFLIKKKEWITNTVQRVSSARSTVRPVMFETGDPLYYLGKKYILEVNVTAGRKRAGITMTAERIVMSLGPDIGKTERQAILEHWYRQQAGKLITEKAERFSRILSVTYAGIRIKEQKTRWGSCSSKGNLNFNWHIVMAPEAMVDYLVIHELCHLIHMNHSPEFWQCVESLCPERKSAIKWLKENRIILTPFAYI